LANEPTLKHPFDVRPAPNMPCNFLPTAKAWVWTSRWKTGKE